MTYRSPRRLPVRRHTEARHPGPLLFPLLCWGLATAGFLLFQHQTGGYGPSTPANIIKCIGDGAPVALVAFLIPWRLRCVTVTVMWLLSLFFIANVCYFRFWDNLLPPAALTMTGNINSALLASGAGLFSLSDLVYILIPAVVTVTAAIPALRPIRKLSALWKYVGSATVLLSMVTAGFLFLHSLNNYRRAGNLPALSAGEYIREISEPVFSASNLYKRYGFTIYMSVSLRELASIARFDRKLDPAERLRIREFLTKRSDITGSFSTPDLTDSRLPVLDSVFRANRRRNLVILIVESLNSEAIGMRVAGREVMPVLSRLATAEGSISALDVVPQIKDGSSGDGHLMTNTGLLPLRSGSASMLAGSGHVFPSLPRLLQRESTAVFADNGETWNQNGFFKNLGFGRIINSTTPGNHTMTGADGIMFGKALGVIPQMKRPFLLEAVTISMHVPFKEAGVNPPEWISKAGLPDDVTAYLTACNYFDTQLGLFLEALKREGIYDDTVTVIVSDHTQKSALRKDPEQPMEPGTRMAFIAANTGLTAKIDRTVGQIDIFPTILGIMGVEPQPDSYLGLGESILNPLVCSAVAPDGTVEGNTASPLTHRQREAWEISDLILSGDYFRESMLSQ